eukprot:TRINITY_DN611_c0_g2_i4.p1 TRINITY_DN611_c0_g2~~TRINITY_DN611_c0_g2_i4.p1  ORF type:complete len:1462 (-),score=373.43 TRINITY_DN611_c0_g2_i4:258-4643(-)
MTKTVLCYCSNLLLSSVLLSWIAFSVSGQLYSIGGRRSVLISVCGNSEPPANVETLSGPPVDLSFLGAVVLSSEIVVAGGFDSGTRTSVKSAWMYSCAGWRSAPSMNHARSGHGLGSAGGKLFAIGGTNGTSVLSSVEQFDPGTGTWTLVAPMQTPRSNFGFSIAGSTIFVFGGCSAVNDAVWSNASSTECAPLASVEMYNISTNSWSYLSPMQVARGRFSAVGFGNELVLAFGGIDTSGGATDATECFSSVAFQWVPCPDMNSLGSAYDFASATSDTGMSFLVGGSSAQNPRSLRYCTRVSTYWPRVFNFFAVGREASSAVWMRWNCSAMHDQCSACQNPCGGVVQCGSPCNSSSFCFSGQCRSLTTGTTGSTGSSGSTGTIRSSGSTGSVGSSGSTGSVRSSGTTGSTGSTTVWSSGSTVSSGLSSTISGGLGTTSPARDNATAGSIVEPTDNSATSSLSTAETVAIIVVPTVAGLLSLAMVIALLARRRSRRRRSHLPGDSYPFLELAAAGAPANSPPAAAQPIELHAVQPIALDANDADAARLVVLTGRDSSGDSGQLTAAADDTSSLAGGHASIVTGGELIDASQPARGDASQAAGGYTILGTSGEASLPASGDAGLLFFGNTSQPARGDPSPATGGDLMELSGISSTVGSQASPPLGDNSSQATPTALVGRNGAVFLDPIHLSAGVNAFSHFYDQLVVQGIAEARVTSQYAVAYCELSNLEQIGTGAFGTVSTAIWRGWRVVVKKAILTDAASNALFVKELRMMTQLRPHPNIVQLLGVCNDPLCIVLEHAPLGSLDKYLSNRNTDVPTIIALHMALGVAAGMRHLHDENVLHCDLSARNVLLMAIDEKKCHVKIADFGLSHLSRDDTGIYVSDTRLRLPVRWTAPELLAGQTLQTRPGDVWSFGVLLWEVLTREVPFNQYSTNHLVIDALERGEVLELPTGRVPSPLEPFLPLCMHRDPQARSTFIELQKLLQIAVDENTPATDTNKGTSSAAETGGKVREASVVEKSASEDLDDQAAERLYQAITCSGDKATGSGGGGGGGGGSSAEAPYVTRSSSVKSESDDPDPDADGKGPAKATLTDDPDAKPPATDGARSVGPRSPTGHVYTDLDHAHQITSSDSESSSQADPDPNPSRDHYLSLSFDSVGPRRSVSLDFVPRRPPASVQPTQPTQSTNPGGAGGAGGPVIVDKDSTDKGSTDKGSTYSGVLDLRMARSLSMQSTSTDSVSSHATPASSSPSLEAAPVSDSDSPSAAPVSDSPSAAPVSDSPSAAPVSSASSAAPGSSSSSASSAPETVSSSSHEAAPDSSSPSSPVILPLPPPPVSVAPAVQAPAGPGCPLPSAPAAAHAAAVVSGSASQAPHESSSSSRYLGIPPRRRTSLDVETSEHRRAATVSMGPRRQSLSDISPPLLDSCDTDTVATGVDVDSSTELVSLASSAPSSPSALSDSVSSVTRLLG